MNPHCPVCGSVEIAMQAAFRGAHPVFAGMQRARCVSCGMGFAHPMPEAAALADYNASYFASAHGGGPGTKHAAAFFSGIARLRLAHVERYLKDFGIEVATVLELGPGPGFFARSWLERFPRTRYLAIETDASCHALLKELGVGLVDAKTLTTELRRTDLIVMSHVLEHVPAPADFLADATASLRPGGALFIEVPCRDYEHKPLDEPHVLFFDKAPMQQLLKHSGFEAIQVSYHGIPVRRLRSSAWAARSALMRARAKLIALGLVAPFAGQRAGMECLADPLERAAVAPFDGHRVSHEPAWWLRALARKQ